MTSTMRPSAFKSAAAGCSGDLDGDFVAGGSVAGGLEGDVDLVDPAVDVVRTNESKALGRAPE